MNTRILWFVLAVLIASVVVWYFSTELIGFAQQLWGWDEATRDKAGFWLDTVTKVFGVISATYLVLIQWFRGDNSDGKILGGVTQPLGFSQGNDSPLRNLEEKYYSALDGSCELLKLNLIEKNIGQNQSGRLSLSEVYQDQRIRLPVKDSEGSGRSPKNSELVHDDRQEPEALMSALEKLDSRRLVILGKLGAGKSSFVNYLTHSVIRSRTESVDDLPGFMSNRPVVRIVLREVGLRVDENSLADGLIWREVKTTVRKLVDSDLLKHEQAELAESEFTVFWQQFKCDFVQQNGVLLLDGLDEVSRDDAAQLLRESLVSFASQAGHEGVFVVITSRPTAYERPEQKLPGFLQLELEPMSPEQIKAFIQQWYQLIERAEPQSAVQKSENLIAEIFDNPALKDRKDLQEMAERPLLLTLLVGLHSAGKSLNRSRPEVYREIIDLLLQRWQENLRDHVTGLRAELQEGMKVLQASPNELLAGLQQLAFQTYKSLENDDSQTLLEFHATDAVGTLYDRCQDANLHHVLDFLEERSTLLVSGNEPKKLQFAHKSFHEYMAARYLLNEGDWEQQITVLLRENPQWWREVFLFMAKDEADGRFGKAVSFLHDSVLEDYRRDNIAEQRLLILAAEAAVEMNLAKQLNDKRTHIQLYRFLQDELVCLLHSDLLELSERADAGRLLGELGDPRPGFGVISEGEHSGLPDIHWSLIPAYSFPIKTNAEKEKTLVSVSAFQVSKSPITNAQFRCFIDAGGYQEERYWQRSEAALAWWKKNSPACPVYWSRREWNNDNHPVVGISWYEALAFCTWLQSTDLYMGKVVRLPTDVEWEYAASGVKGLVFPWGKEVDAGLGNFSDSGLGRTSSVGLFPGGVAVGPDGKGFGLYDMGGNVWEWTSSLWGKSFSEQGFPYQGWNNEQEVKRNDLDESDEILRIVRGGSWVNSSDFCRCAVRLRHPPDLRFYYLGFRVVCVE